VVEREKGPNGRPWNGANRALVTAIDWFGLRCLGRETSTSGELENRFGLPVRRAERSGSAAEHVSKRRKKAKRSEAKRQTEAAALHLASFTVIECLDRDVFSHANPV